MIYVIGDTVTKDYLPPVFRTGAAGGRLARGSKASKKASAGLIIMENRPEWPISYFGLLLAGGTAVPVDLQSRPEHVAYVLEQTGATVVFAGPKAPLAEIAKAPSVQHLVVAGEPPACPGPGGGVPGTPGLAARPGPA